MEYSKLPFGSLCGEGIHGHVFLGPGVRILLYILTDHLCLRDRHWIAREGVELKKPAGALQPSPLWSAGVAALSPPSP